ncbi:MAG: glycosyltransferase family 39 protein [Patescibacteria group bacterium]|nr:glycosyltransferase family 39 protein [Patescibacteria group bacterium]
MKIKKKKLIILITLLILGFVLRFYRYSYFPVIGETADESAWAMLGASLIQDQEPMAWSHFGAYVEHGAVVDEDSHLVKPSLDHPPLFSLIPGIVHALQQRPIDQPSIKAVRFPMIILGVINIYLLYVLANKIFKKNKLAVYFSTAIYTMAPIFVFSSRLVLAENWLITLILLSLIFIYKKKKTKQDYQLLFLISLVAVLSKFSGLILPASLLVLGFKENNRKYRKIGLFSAVLGLSLFALYGAIFNWQLFVDVLLSQSNRQLGLATILNCLFLHPMIVDRLFIDGWLFLGLLAGFSLIFSKQKKTKKWLPLTILFLMNLGFVLMSVGEQSFHGWYGYLNYPFLILASGDLLARIIKKGNTLLFAFIWILLLPSIRLAMRCLGIYLEMDQMILRLIGLLGFIPLGLDFFNKKLSKKMMWLVLVIIILANLLVVFKLTHEIYWEDNLFF